MKILVVDDNESITKSLEKYLKIKGNNVTVTNEGSEGFDLIKKHYIWPKILNKLKEIIITLIKEKKYKK